MPSAFRHFMGAYRHVLIDWFEFKPGDNIVEVGAEDRPGPNTSTKFLADYCAARGLNFWTVDTNPRRIERAALLGCHAVCAKGEDFLSDFGQPIHFAYLDNVDWMGGYMEVPANVVSANAHLLQTRRLLQWMTSGVVIFDDTWFDQGFGKGIFAARFLAESGFYIAESGPGWLVMARGMFPTRPKPECPPSAYA